MLTAFCRGAALGAGLIYGTFREFGPTLFVLGVAGFLAGIVMGLAIGCAPLPA